MKKLVTLALALCLLLSAVPGLAVELLSAGDTYPLNTDKTAIARRTASLERKGYLRREPNPEDGRSQLLFPTALAKGLRDAKADAESAFSDYLLAELDEESRAAVLSALDTLYRRSKEQSRAGFPHIRQLLEEQTHEAKE